ADVNAQGGYYGNALQAAADNGHDTIIHLLLTAGADVNAQGGHYGNALQAAADNGHDTIIRLLLTEGADVNAQGGYYGNALQDAVHKRNAGIVSILLGNGANIIDNNGRSALDIAEERGYDDIVNLIRNHQSRSDFDTDIIQDSPASNQLSV
ncbi:ankyrin, partial [Wilcoxina mikolae CBS 423.85]